MDNDTFSTVAEFMPDQPDFMNPGSGLVQNVLPRTERSYGPFAGLSVASTPISNRCQGAFAMKDNAGNSFLFCGDISKLYHMAPGDSGPQDASLAGGYATAGTDRWSFALFGQRVIATNFGNLIQSYVQGTDTKFSNMITTGMTTLSAKYVAVIRDFVFFGYTSDATYGTQTQRCWWTAINNPTSVPDPTTTAAATIQSDFQDLVGDYGNVQGIVGNLGNSHGAIFMDRAVWRVNYQGSPNIFRFDIAEGVRGTPAPGSIAQLGANVYYLGEDGFYAFDGANSTPIGFEKVDRFFYGDVDKSNMHRITSAVDPLNKMIYWAYPGIGSTSGTPNRVLVYNWALKRWAITAPNDITLEVMLHSWSFGFSLEQLDALYPNIDAPGVPSFDDPSLTGGKSILSCFDTTHSLSNFAGTNLAATVDTSEIQPVKGGRCIINQTRPIVDAGTPSITIGTRNRTTDAVAFKSPVLMDSNGWCPQRAEGRYMRGRITVPANTVFNHIEGIDFSVAPAGAGFR